jgi:hydroxymethylpyrimidine/phosphomethylpyrimidine kinase
MTFHQKNILSQVMRIPTVLTIAGSDSCGGAGIQGDLKTLEAFRVYGLAVLTSITAQNTQGIDAVFDLPATFVRKQMKSVFGDIRIDAVKIGMLSNQSIIKTVASELRKRTIKNIVLDPVMCSKSGDALLAPSAKNVLLEYLIPLACVITPNIPEMEELCLVEIKSEDDMRCAAEALVKLGARGVLVKGGHLCNTSESVDILFDGKDFHEFRSERIDVPGGIHGTGCALASAIAAGLAHGYTLLESVREAKAYMTGAIRNRHNIGLGHPVLSHNRNSMLQ